MMNGGAIFHSSKRQTSVSMTSTEAEVKAVSLLVHHLEYAISFWSEIAGSKHNAVRCILDNQTAIKHISSGADSGASSPYLRHKCFAESKVYSGQVWFDFVHGSKNIADILTKQVRSTPEFIAKGGGISGCRPSMVESEKVSKFLLASAQR